MGPKKKKGGKKGGKKKSAVKSASGNPGVNIDDVLNEVTKEFYLLQIRDLEQKISRYQEKCDKLEIINKKVQEEFDQLSTDKHEISSYLKRQLEEKSIENIELRGQLSISEGSRKAEKEKCMVEVASVKSEMVQMQDRLSSENTILGGKLASLEEFRVQRAALTRKSEDMHRHIREQEAYYKEQIYQLERKAVLDKDKLKREMLARVNSVAAEFRQVSNKQMADTTKKAIQENVTINSQLAKMSDRTMEMITENDEIKTNERLYRQNIEILEHSEKELMKKNATHKKLIMMLTEKSREQEHCLDEFVVREMKFEEVEQELQELKVNHETVTASEEALKTERDDLLKKCELFENERTELFEDKNYLIGILSDASHVIKRALQHNNDEDPATTEMKNANLLQKVVDILNVAAEMGVGINAEDLASAKQLYKRKKKRVFLGPLPNENETIYEEMCLAKPKEHYNLGDLGLVPPSPTNFHKKLLNHFQPKSPNRKYRLSESEESLMKNSTQKEIVLKLPLLVLE